MPIARELNPGSTSPEGGSRAYWLCQCVGWSFYLWPTILQMWHAPGTGHGRAVLEPLLATLLGILLTHAFRRFARRRGWLNLKALALAPRVSLASIVLAMLLVAPLQLIELGLYGDSVRSPWLQFLSAVFRWTPVFFAWISFYAGFAFLQQGQRARVQAKQLVQALEAAELRALKSQLNPHFLFNALNSVRALIADDPALAQKTITQLARMLRYTLGSGEDDLVLFERELATVDDYLAIESLRLAERLTVVKNVGSGANGARLPVMLLQTLVENAVKHGIAQLPQGGALRIDARLVNGVLALEIENPRPDVQHRENESSPGIGISNATERLRLLFGPAARLELDLSQPGRALARVEIPQTP